MPLRLQKAGKQEPWTLEELAEGLESFYKQYSRYPTATEVDAYDYLPSARQIERRFGGLVELRKRLKLDSQTDFRSGIHSSQRAHSINKRAHEIEQTVYEFLQNVFKKEFVHREYFFTDDQRTRADFFVYDSRKGFCVDVFYPNSLRNLTGCLNIKLDKYQATYMREYPVIFLQMNEDITQEMLDNLVENKKKRLLTGQRLLSWNSFKGFCKSRKPLALA
ncbi:MAG: hypothetical protein A3C06_04810 [Candidatus Taylorbacteria bacterium RIFCSPHIGHO2_02_FULL_46_13]|uniref:Uncharacterized protein n=1 Tax=Candidatus Taylorbacteria bacterium RIFCSPHIGHO2_02_FULL_46_13 TaxID=1802312 RepID=A0A1G2MTG9_9BACT|nr:MAG: hypothetical protein A3C06_04810 [Candidatus Taylorbacteria bacterium RIFCSPHIGHO2_02_FULL_46_13]